MRYTCLQTIYELAKKNKKICFVGSDLGFGVLKEFKKNFKDRFFMEGVSEQHITGMAAGLAMEGFIPYFNTIATFITRRNFEQNVVDLGLHKVPVRLIGNGGGLVYAPLGPTHQAIEDISIMRTIPNMHIIAPCDRIEMKKLITQTVKIKNPLYIRLAKGGDEIVTTKKKIKYGKPILFGSSKNILFVSTGVMTQECIKVQKLLKKEKINSSVLHFGTIKPFDYKSLLTHAKNSKIILTVEENILSGGFGSMVLEILNDMTNTKMKKVFRIGIKDQFVKKYGTQAQLFDYCGISSNKIFLKVKKILDEKKY